MAHAIKNTKIIFDPLWGIVNITDYLPMLDVPQFQALGFKYQLGVTNFLFPAATHTRKQHSLGAFRRTQDLADRWLHRGFINKDEARLIIAFALWHDIGHGPFSHVVEDVTRDRFGRDHDQNGAIIINQLKDAVEKTGIDFSEFKKMFTHVNPLYRAVHDKNLGTEKLDYLTRDAYYTLGEIPGVEYLAHHTYFINGKLMIDEKAIDQAKAIQEFYVKMYKNVYLRKNSAIAQRMVQKMTAELMKHKLFTEEEFWALTDFGLLGHFETSQNTVVQEYYRRFMSRELPKTAIALRPDEFVAIDKREDKAQTSLGTSEEAMQGIIASQNFSTPAKLDTLEKGIEELTGLPSHSVLVVPPSSLERFVSQDILISLPGDKTANLSDYFADHFRALEEEGRSYLVMRVCTFDEHRETLSSPGTAEAVRSYILSLV
ncbi:MAG: HD domain-containing protein [bacterium]|nr:HD domain-containing protein [bacterium]